MQGGEGRLWMWTGASVLIVAAAQCCSGKNLRSLRSGSRPDGRIFSSGPINSGSWKKSETFSHASKDCGAGGDYSGVCKVRRLFNVLCAYWSSGTVMEKGKKRKNICMRKYILGSRVSFGIRDLPFQKNVLNMSGKYAFRSL